MKHVGLCVSCVADRNCVFPRPAPVVFCEEFDSGPQQKNSGLTKRSAVGARKIQSDPQEAVMD